MWKNIWQRIQSPVVIGQIVTIVVGGLVLLAPQVEPTAKIITGVIMALLNLFAGLNNPTDKKDF